MLDRDHDDVRKLHAKLHGVASRRGLFAPKFREIASRDREITTCKITSRGSGTKFTPRNDRTTFNAYAKRESGLRNIPRYIEQRDLIHELMFVIVI